MEAARPATPADLDTVVDLAGLLAADADYDAPAVPVRLVDTRIGTGVAGQFGER